MGRATIKLPNQVGQRILRAKSPNSIELKKLKKKYKGIVGTSLEKHKDVIKGLKAELDFRRESGSLEYLQLLSVWLNKGTWEKYLSIDDDLIDTAHGRHTNLL